MYKYSVFRILLCFIVTIGSVNADITFKDEVLPNYPDMLIKSNYLEQRQEVDIEKTGIGKAMEKLKKKYDKIDIRYLAPSTYYTPTFKKNMEGFERYSKLADKHLKKVKATATLATALQKTAEKAAKELKKTEPDLKDFRKYVEKIAKKAKEFAKACKKTPKKTQKQLKAKKKYLKTFLKRIKSESLPNVKIGIDKARELQREINKLDSEEEKKDYFNGNLRYSARPLGQGLGQVRLNTDVFVDPDDAQDLWDELLPWSNNNRAVGDNGGEETTEAELEVYLEIVEKVEDWFAKQEQ